ncbi:hypothetical protein [Streptomyces sp. NBC_01803]|uniref:hypothetical protein n=1 Tax=Streptomyces sp. NBC_01803 TaxID=2975946 RepID=UPI002DD86E2D|nr:hypothetical protein [Streptomyces sp. NBC_01803]WSA45117.1 hypothetical protein OIE51_13425 [Streptomyces sp. NBC_01803]
MPGSAATRDLAATGYDLLVVGHEYPTLPAWRRIRDRLGCDVATFQHNPDFQHAPDAFDGKRDRLYCYSPEMIERYAAHQPRAELAVHLGLGEAEPPAIKGDDLVWVGRIDEQKAPHLALRAAELLGRRPATRADEERLTAWPRRSARSNWWKTGSAKAPADAVSGGADRAARPDGPQRARTCGAWAAVSPTVIG